MGTAGERGNEFDFCEPADCVGREPSVELQRSDGIKPAGAGWWDDFGGGVELQFGHRQREFDGAEPAEWRHIREPVPEAVDGSADATGAGDFEGANGIR